MASDLKSLSIKNRDPNFQSFFHLYLYTHTYTWKMPLWLNFMFFKRNGRSEIFDYLVLLTVHFFTWSCCVVITLGASCCNREFSHNFWLRRGCCGDFTFLPLPWRSIQRREEHFSVWCWMESWSSPPVVSLQSCCFAGFPGTCQNCSSAV